MRSAAVREWPRLRDLANLRRDHRVLTVMMDQLLNPRAKNAQLHMGRRRFWPRHCGSAARRVTTNHACTPTALAKQRQRYIRRVCQ